MAETESKSVGLTRKLGPLPVWAWGILGGIAVYFLYVRSKGSSGGAQSPTATVLDPNAVDPTTGLTYGQELSSGFPTGGALQGAANSSPGSSTDTSGGVSPIDALDQELTSFLQAQQDFGQVAGALGYNPPNPSTTTTTAAASPPVQNTSPPHPFLAQDKPFLAPGVAAAPNYKLTPPKGAPAAARWAGPHPPGPNWVGIGGGWYAPKSSMPAKKPQPTAPPKKPPPPAKKKR